MYAVLGILTLLVSLISFTYSYLLALNIAIISVLAFSLFIFHQDGSERANVTITHSIILSDTGEVQFNGESSNFQLLASSRLSFMGVWLDLAPSGLIATATYPLSKAASKKTFIFRDSINAQDYSRIANVIRRLNH